VLRAATYTSHILEGFDIPVNLSVVQSYTHSKFKPIVIVNDNHEDDDDSNQDLNIHSRNNISVNDNRIVLNINNITNEDMRFIGKENCPTSANDYNNYNLTNNIKNEFNQTNNCIELDEKNRINNSYSIQNEKLDFIDEFILQYPIPYYLTKDYISKNFNDITNFSK